MRMTSVWRRVHASFQEKRMNVFLAHFSERGGRLLDLGGGDGSFLFRFRHHLAQFEIHVADIDEGNLEKAKNVYGFNVIQLKETGPLPFEDQEWDVVFCNSVIEHYTGPKESVLSMRSAGTFRASARFHQSKLAAEIRRVGQRYFVQTPHVAFPIESHTQFPFIGYLPRAAQVSAVRFLNGFWLKKTQPDWYLLGKRDMQSLFPEAKILVERLFGLPKSLIAIKS